MFINIISSYINQSIIIYLIIIYINYNKNNIILISGHELILNTFQLSLNQKDQIFGKNLFKDMPMNVPKCSHFFESFQWLSDMGIPSSFRNCWVLVF